MRLTRASTVSHTAWAREEFDALLEYANGFDAHAHYATLLVEWGDTARARARLPSAATARA